MKYKRFFLACLLLAYPRRYREALGEEMLSVIDQRLKDGRGVWAEAAGLIRGAIVEWMRRPSPLVVPEADEVAAAEARVKMLTGRIVHAIANHQFETARACCREEEQAREQLRVLREKCRIAS